MADVLPVAARAGASAAASGMLGSAPPVGDWGPSAMLVTLVLKATPKGVPMATVVLDVPAPGPLEDKARLAARIAEAAVAQLRDVRLDPKQCEVLQAKLLGWARRIDDEDLARGRTGPPIEFVVEPTTVPVQVNPVPSAPPPRPRPTPVSGGTGGTPPPGAPSPPAPSSGKPAGPPIPDDL